MALLYPFIRKHPLVHVVLWNHGTGHGLPPELHQSSTKAPPAPGVRTNRQRFLLWTMPQFVPGHFWTPTNWLQSWWCWLMVKILDPSVLLPDSQRPVNLPKTSEPQMPWNPYALGSETTVSVLDSRSFPLIFTTRGKIEASIWSPIRIINPLKLL